MAVDSLRAAPRRPVLVVLGVSLVAAVAFLLAPRMGTDLAAQVAHGEFWGRHGAAVLDFGWYGGTSPYGYSLLTPPLMSWLGARVLGAIAAVIASVSLTILLTRTGARRVLVAGLLGALGIFGNIVSGRVTFTVGLAFGLAALLTLRHRTVAVIAAVLAAASSPVAALFVALAGVALIVGARRVVDGLVLTLGAGVPMIGIGLLFGTDGPMNTIGSDTLRSCTVSLLVAAVVPHRTIRAGALLGAAGVVAAALLTTPVGLNAGRLTATFALATIAGYAVVPGRLVMTGLLGGVLLWQHPVAVNDLRRAGDPASSPAYFRPLLDEVARLRPAGRIEVVPTFDYWEAAYVPGTVPLARGWFRQADAARNPLFFDGKLTPARYESWLRQNAVSLVAVADTPPAPAGRQEAHLLHRRQPFLTKVWQGGAWTVYAVNGREPALLRDGAAIVDVTTPGDAMVRVRWSRWLTLHGPGGCLHPTSDGWTTLHSRTSGRYILTGSLRPGPIC